MRGAPDEPISPEDAETAEIRNALARLEERFEHSNAHISHLIQPLDSEVARLAEEAENIAHPHPVAGDYDPHEGDVVHVDPERFAQTGRHWPSRVIVAFGVIALIAIGAGTWAWLWQTQEVPRHRPTPSSKVAVPSAASVPAPAPGAHVAVPAFTDDVKLPTTPAQVASLRARAEQRDVNAEYTLGVALLEGHGAAQNVHEAGEWLATAAVAGQPRAQFRLAQLYARGIGYARDPSQAFFWMESAAEQGITEAAYRLGRMYAEGNGVPQSYTLAARWYEVAAKKNHPDALYALGQIYESGLDVRKNIPKALAYYRRAAAAGSKAAANRVAALAAGTANPVRHALGRTSPPPPAAKAAPAPASDDTPLTRAEIAELQRLLVRLNFDPGPADGRAGARTAAAIRQFEHMAGLPEDGRPSRLVLGQVRDVAGNLGIGAH